MEVDAANDDPMIIHVIKWRDFFNFDLKNNSIIITMSKKCRTEHIQNSLVTKLWYSLQVGRMSSRDRKMFSELALMQLIACRTSFSHGKKPYDILGYTTYKCELSPTCTRDRLYMCMHSTFVRDLNSRENPTLFEILLFGEHCHM